MFYTIYKITNLINGKFYIGKHQTNNLDDNYFGSGKILRAAIKKYGKDNFKKEILEVYDQEWKMNLAEKIYVVVDIDVSYNICPGGKGGWGYVNKEIITVEDRIEYGKIGGFLHKERLLNDVSYYLKFQNQSKRNIQTMKKNGKINKFVYSKGMLNKSHSDNAKQKISDKQKGNLNSQFNTCWMTDGIKNIKVKYDNIESALSLGFKRGRILNRVKE